MNTLMNLGLHTTKIISLEAQDLLGSQDGLCSTEVQCGVTQTSPTYAWLESCMAFCISKILHKLR